LYRPAPSEVFSATSHSSCAHAAEWFHHCPEVDHGPDAANTVRDLLPSITDWGFSRKSTLVSSAGRNFRRATAGRSVHIPTSAYSLENACTAKLPGRCESTVRGDPTHGIRFSSSRPTTPRILARVISNCSACGVAGANNPPCKARGFTGVACTVSLLIGAKKEQPSSSRQVSRSKTLASETGNGSFQTRSYTSFSASVCSW